MVSLLFAFGRDAFFILPLFLYLILPEYPAGPPQNWEALRHSRLSPATLAETGPGQKVCPKGKGNTHFNGIRTIVASRSCLQVRSLYIFARQP
jgi:hypothetical protein